MFRGKFSTFYFQFQRFLQQPCIKFLGHTISYGCFIVLIILSSLLFVSEFQKPLKSLSRDFPNISKALNESITSCQNQFKDKCFYYPFKDDFVFRQNTPTVIDVAITIYVVGKTSKHFLLLKENFFENKRFFVARNHPSVFRWFKRLSSFVEQYR